jgi:hypothetical protein
LKYYEINLVHPYSLKAFQDYQSMPRGALILHLGDLKARDKTNKLCPSEIDSPIFYNDGGENRYSKRKKPP